MLNSSALVLNCSLHSVIGLSVHPFGTAALTARLIQIPSIQRVFSTFLPQVVRMYFVSAPLFPRNCFIFIDKEARQAFSTKFDRLLVGFWQQWLRWWRGVSFISVDNETWRNIYRGKLRTVLGSGTCFYDNFGISLWQPEALCMLPTFLDERARWRQFSI